MANNYDERDVTFDILEEIGVLSTQDTGWTKEVNLVSWNGGLAKYDIRDWDPSHERMSRGITLKEEEMRRMLSLMKKRRTNFRGKRDAQENALEDISDENLNEHMEAAGYAETENAEVTPAGAASDDAADEIAE